MRFSVWLALFQLGNMYLVVLFPRSFIELCRFGAHKVDCLYALLLFFSSC